MARMWSKSNGKPAAFTVPAGAGSINTSTPAPIPRVTWRSAMAAGFIPSASKSPIKDEDGVYIDVKKGGTLIEYADEDPYIRQHYDDELKKSGVECEMPAV